MTRNQDTEPGGIRPDKAKLRRGVMLSQHFTLSEFEHSALAHHLGIDNRTPRYRRPALKALCEQVLEPTRAHFGCEIKVVSGYRSRMLNTAMLAAPDSQHLKGEAVDFKMRCKPPLYAVWEWMCDHVEYDQLVYTINSVSEEVWIHVSLRPHHNRHEAWVRIDRK